jgi:predicted ATP-grasp superfamily ATP-dependent carboligase
MNILIGEISSYKAIVISKFIKKNYKNVTILSYDTRRFTKKINSKYTDYHFIINKVNFEIEIQQIILSYKIDYFFPVINDSLSNILLRKSLYANTLNYIGEIEAYNTLNDKILLHKLATKLDLRVPIRYESIITAKFPYVIKPTNLSSAKGVIYVHSHKDIPEYHKNSNLIIQQFVQGVGVGYSFYCRNGEILNGYGHKRIAEYPITGGSSTYREGYKNPKMIMMASKIVRYLNYTGFAMFEYKLTSENELYLIEVNPRIWGSINQGLVNGINYFQGVLGKEDKPIIKVSTDKKTFLSPLIYLSIFRHLINFEIQPLYFFLKNIRNNIPDVSLFYDYKGYLSLLLRKL